MKLQEIEERVGELGSLEGMDFLYGLLGAYGLPKASITRLRSGTYDKAEVDEERLWRSKVWFRDASGLSDDELYPLIDAASVDVKVTGLNPRFLIVRNETRLLAKDMTTAATLDIVPGELVANAGFFLAWAGIEKTRFENVNVADVKAAEKMAKLYDEIIRHNEIEDQEAIHDLNVFFSRLLFCFFAEDTGVFEEGSFTNAVGSLTEESGSDTAEFLDRLFALLDVEPSERNDVPHELGGFGYVNGKLFERRSAVPHFSARARSIVLECGTLDWSQINPDIFGSMIQAVVHPSQRAGLGMHYTSVENIRKVIRPLFLDEMEGLLDSAGLVDISGAGGADDVLVPSEMEEDAARRKAVRKLERFIDRLAAIQVFDPACGSGNFLVIAYKELRRLEHMALQRIAELDPSKAGLFKISSIELDSFYGIEIDDFAHEVAILSLWLAKHQMNIEFEELFGAEIPLIPLIESGQITCGNAARLDWTEVCDPAKRETFVLGNPPYAGSRVQTPEQKDDFRSFFAGARYPRDLDYVSLWFLKGADYLSSSTQSSAAFVSTNSISQGEQVGMLWPLIFQKGVHIAFAYQSFLWSNAARGNAGVTCVVVGLSTGEMRRHLLYSDEGRREVRGINPYLASGSTESIVVPRRRALSGFPRAALGSKPADGGNLLLSEAEADDLVHRYPEATQIVRRYGGGREALQGGWRACLWITEEDLDLAKSIPEVAERLQRVSELRAKSSNAATREAALTPHLFTHRAHRGTSAVLIPEVSSERRIYIPLDFVGSATVISNTAYAIYDAEPWLFGIVQSRMHMVWVRTVAGRLKSDFRYSAGLVYNTYPAPALTAKQRETLTERAISVLGAREQFSGQTLAELYDPDRMPRVLRESHDELDEAVDGLYSSRGFATDEDRLARLFEMYEEAIAQEAADS